MYHGLYDYVQTNLTYSNGRMASNRLMLTQITEIFEVKTGFGPIKVDDLSLILPNTVRMIGEGVKHIQRDTDD